MPRIRVKRMEKELLRTLNTTLQFTIRDERLQWITISDVRLSPDFTYARIYFTHLTDIPDEKVQKTLTRSSGVFKDAIAKGHFMRVIPELKFIPDEKAKEAQRLEKIFAKIHQEDKEEDANKKSE